MNIDFLSEELPTLAEGKHDGGSGQLCMMEFVAFIERLPHSDSPPCTAPEIAAFGRRWNDRCPPHLRNQCLPYLPYLVGTVNPDAKEQRLRIFVDAARDWAVRALDGRIDPQLVNELRDAQSYQEIEKAAKAAKAADYYADYYAAYYAAYYVASVADYAANAVAYYAVNVAYYAVNVAYYAAQILGESIWIEALEVMKAAALVGQPKPKVWTEADYQRGFEALSA